MDVQKNSQPLVDSSTAASVQRADAVTAPPSLEGAPEFGTALARVGPAGSPFSPQEAPEFGTALADVVGPVSAPPPAPQGTPGFAVVPQQGAPMEAPLSPEGPPGFWVPPVEGTTVVAAPQVAPAKATPQQQHFAPVMMPGSLPVQAASMGVMATMSLQDLAMATLQPSQGTTAQSPLPMGIPHMMDKQQAQRGHIFAPPPLPLGPLPMMMQPQHLQTNAMMVEQTPQPISLAPVMQLQQPPQATPAVVEQIPQPFGPPPLMQQQPPQPDPMIMPQPPFSAPSCKRQRFDQHDMTYGQHMTGDQQEMTTLNAASYGPFLQNGLPYPPPNASSTLYIEGLPKDCTTREVAHIFRQYTGFREVRLVNRVPARQPICFVDFSTPVEAFYAMGSLQGYKFDQQDHRSPKLHLQFSHSPRVASYAGS